MCFCTFEQPRVIVRLKLKDSVPSECQIRSISLFSSSLGKLYPALTASRCTSVQHVFCLRPTQTVLLFCFTFQEDLKKKKTFPGNKTPSSFQVFQFLLEANRTSESLRAHMTVFIAQLFDIYYSDRLAHSGFFFNQRNCMYSDPQKKKKSKISNPDQNTMPWFTRMDSHVSGFNTRACSSTNLFIMVLILSKQNSSQSVFFFYTCWNDVDFVWWCAWIFRFSLHEILHKQSPTHLSHTTRFLFPLITVLQGGGSSSSCSTFLCTVFIWHPPDYFYVNFTQNESCHFLICRSKCCFCYCFFFFFLLI